MRTLLDIIPAVLLLATCCTPREAEVSVLPSTELSAYMVETKTGYTIDESAKKAVFSWLEGDRIDVAVRCGSTYAAVPFTAASSGTQSRFSDGAETGDRTLADIRQETPGAELSPWAFYPSGSSWSISGSDITVHLPSGDNYDASNPLAIVPMFGIADSNGDYAFSPSTAVLAIPVKGITPEMDFIALESEVPISGEFTLAVDGNCGTVRLEGAKESYPGVMSLSFSELSGDYTFYFPLPAGTIPAGLSISLGQTSDWEGRMTLVSQSPITLTRGRISRTPPIQFQSSGKWTTVTTEGKFLDDFLWGRHSSFTTGTYVDVTIERSQDDPSVFRIANPYSVACSTFGYTPHTDGIKADPYLVFTVSTDGKITFEPFLTGIEDNDSGGRPMMISHATTWNAGRTGKESKVLWFSSSDATLPVRAQLAGVYSDPADASYYYTRDGEGTTHSDRIHIIFSDEPEPSETWTSLGTGRFIDNFFWNNNSFASAVDVEIFKSDADAGRYRIANPYLIANKQFGRSGYEGDEYFCFSVGSDGAVTYETLVTGMTLTMGGALVDRNFAIKMPGDASATKVTSGTAAEPLVLQMGAVNYDSNDASYYYTRATYDLKYLYFPGYDEKAYVEPYKVPMLAAFHNPVASLSLPGGTLEKLVVKITSGDISKVTGLRLWQNATGGWMESDYVAPDAGGTVTMTGFTRPTVSGAIDLNFWVNDPDIASSYTFDVKEVVIGGISYEIEQDNSFVHIFGVRVNNGGDAVNVRGSTETVASFRIPALVTSNAGTLIAAYDVRYASSADLQGDIDVGMKRSTDGGKTWSDLKLIMDMGEYGGLAQNQNGIGDPCLLVDENTGRIFCFAVWAHDHYNDSDRRCLAWAGTGFGISDTPQFVMVYSDDDGVTWSSPVNITTQVKKDAWRMTFQGPGRGITMKDGTLVVPIQHQEGASKSMHGLYPLNSGIMYSKDHGTTWQAFDTYAHATTSESAVAEIEPGVLMLSMRDETDSKARRVYTTTDLGKTWTAHSSNGKVIEPTCEASLLHVDAADNALGKDLLLFSNPNSTSGRVNMTIQASLDKGATWSHSLLLDAGGSLGYSCLTMVDKNTVGILYESSKGSILFQAVPLTDIVK